MMKTSSTQPRLSNRLMRHVLLPLALTWLVGTGIAIAVAGYFTQQAYDRALADDAYLVASHVKLSSQGGLEFNLNAKELTAVLFDQSELILFAVLNEDGSLLAGHPGLAPAPQRLIKNPVYDELVFQNRRLRSVTLNFEQPQRYTVVLAQTTSSRERVVQQLVLFSIAPQLLLLGLLAVALHRAIQSDVQPISELEQALSRRDADDLTPVPVSSRTRDIQHLGHAVNELFARIEQSIRAQREFSGNVAHELRTPLAGIRAQAEYGLAHEDPQVWREQLQGIAQSQARASRLIDQLLALALADEAKQHLALERVNLSQVVQDSVLRHLPRADGLQVDLGAQGVESPVWVMGQQALIEGVLNNLLDNALRYGRNTSADSPSRLTVALEVLGQGAQAPVRLTVTDNGPGISPAQQQQVMQRWSRGSAGDALREGAGLGLAIVAEYARLLKTRWWLGTAPSGHGLQVALLFDALAQPSGEGEASHA
jgi:two-component system sensor histidine kinase TctE